MKILVTAGPTREPVDPVRYLSNRSSGKMGYAVARAAVLRGHSVTLISGPVCIQPPGSVKIVPVMTAAEMLTAVQEHVEWCDALVMSAAVADWRPRQVAALKIKKLNPAMTLELEPTQDILSAIRLRKGGRIFVGFAAETDRLISEARRKLKEKGLDMIVANDVTKPGSGFEVDTNQVTIIGPGDRCDELPLLGKDEVGRLIIERIEDVWGKTEP